jgi:hypothetical protein
MFMNSFYASKSPKHKRQSSHQSLFALLGSTLIKAACKYVDEIDPWFPKPNFITTCIYQLFLHLILLSQEKAGNGSLVTPCRPNNKTTLENNDNVFDDNRPFPDIPLLVLEADIICKR